MLIEWVCISCTKACKRYMKPDEVPVMDGHKCPDGYEYICRFVQSKTLDAPSLPQKGEGSNAVLEYKCPNCGCTVMYMENDKPNHCDLCGILLPSKVFEPRACHEVVGDV